MEQLITTSTETSCSSGGVNIVGGSGCSGAGGIVNIGGGKKTTKIVENFEGVTCKNFMSPVTTTTNIQM